MSWRLKIPETGLLVVDVQEKLVAAVKEPADWVETVSYTHLTLPTKA